MAVKGVKNVIKNKLSLYILEDVLLLLNNKAIHTSSWKAAIFKENSANVNSSIIF